MVESPTFVKNGRGDRIRTCDLLVPNQALYQAKLHPGTKGQGRVVSGECQDTTAQRYFLVEKSE
jgi:hypothetical protein